MTEPPTQAGAVDQTEMLNTGITENAELAWSYPNDDDSAPDDVHLHRWPTVAAIASLIICASAALVVGTYRAEDAPTAQPGPVPAATPAPWRPPPMPSGSYKAVGVDGSSKWSNGATPETIEGMDTLVIFESYDAPNCTPESCLLTSHPITESGVVLSSSYHYADGIWKEDAPGFYTGNGYKVQIDADIVPDTAGRWRQRDMETIVSCPDSGCGKLPLGASMSFDVILSPTGISD